MLACIRDLGGRPCPRCYVLLKNIPDLGTKKDLATRLRHRTDTDSIRKKIGKARKEIFRYGHGVRSSSVNRILKDLSLVPTLVSLTMHH